MPSLLSRLAVCAGLPVLSPVAARGGALLEPPGDALAIVTTTFADAAKAYDARGRLISAPSYRKFEAQGYVEYGVYDWLTIIAESNYMNFRGAASNLDYLNILTAEAKAGASLSVVAAPGPSYAGLGVGSAGARVRLAEFGSMVISLEAKLRAATPSARQFLDMKTQLQEDVRLQLGHPVELFGMTGFGDLQIGYRTHGQNGGEIRADFTYGLRPFDAVLLLAQSFTAATPGRFGSSFMVSQKFAASAVYDLTTNISVQLGVFAAVRGVNSSAERGALAAIWYRFQGSSARIESGGPPGLF
ncbi:MAG: hypothetical protein HYZ60_04275 [Methylocystis sp.]|nr:hypothetical protein [Methylocystis sp.]